MSSVATPFGDKPLKFGAVVRALFADREEFLTNTGNINWMAVSERLPGVHYETLRKSLAGDRIPTSDLMEKIAELAAVDPTVFVEYRLYLAQKEFNVREVGWEQAAENLQRWAEASTRKKRK